MITLYLCEHRYPEPVRDIVVGVAMPDLDLIKQVEQAVRDRRAYLTRSWLDRGHKEQQHRDRRYNMAYLGYFAPPDGACLVAERA
jgi:hypothetical protein